MLKILIALRLTVAALLLATANAGAQESVKCPPAAGVALQVLGSGGPIADDSRASSSYLVWVDGRSRVMIDAGGGAFLRFGEARAKFSELDFVGLSHFHTDHSADFPALLKSGNFSRRERPLRVAGPDGKGAFPGLKSWLDALLAPDGGAYAYLSGYLDGTAGLAKLELHEVAGDEGRIEVVYESEHLKVHAMHVPHGIVPAIAFRVLTRDRQLVFAADQNGSDPEFIRFAKDSDVLVMHMVVPKDTTGTAIRLHARPSTIGRIAREADPDLLVLSHFMARSLRDIGANVAIVRKAFNGKLTIAEDLLCLSL